MRVLVTGASGFIGGAVCTQLRGRGHEVTALVRRSGSEPAGAAAAVADVRDPGALARALAESRPECVVHLAAEIASQRDARKVQDVNVEGTRRLVAACAEHRPRIVFASTVVTGDAQGVLLCEDEALPVHTPYGRAKQEGERIVAESGLPWVVVRPSHVYGPGGWYANELVPLLRRPGRFAVIGSGENMWDVVHVDDVAAAFVLAAESAPAGSTYHVADDEPITYYDFMALTASTLGVGKPRRLPVLLARLAAGANAVDAVVRSARSSNARAKRELGLTLRFPSAREGVPDALARLAAQANARSASSAT
jgi:nucleoside-diphosphate-sugar epimerase